MGLEEQSKGADGDHSASHLLEAVCHISPLPGLSYRLVSLMSSGACQWIPVGMDYQDLGSTGVTLALVMLCHCPQTSRTAGYKES